MKHNILLFAIAATLAVFIGLAFSSTGAAGEEQSASSKIYRRAWSDTITDAGNDTLTVPVTLSSLWTYNYVVNATQTSGTTAIIAILQENNATSGAIWYELERDTIAGAGLVRLHGLDIGSFVKGSRQRLILDGSGTQVSPYTVTLTSKMAN